MIAFFALRFVLLLLYCLYSVRFGNLRVEWATDLPVLLRKRLFSQITIGRNHLTAHQVNCIIIS
jgi:hypothetical protein